MLCCTCDSLLELSARLPFLFYHPFQISKNVRVHTSVICLIIFRLSCQCFIDFARGRAGWSGARTRWCAPCTATRSAPGPRTPRCPASRRSCRSAGRPRARTRPSGASCSTRTRRSRSHRCSPSSATTASSRASRPAASCPTRSPPCGPSSGLTTRASTVRSCSGCPTRAIEQ